jgi:dihydrofolate reductase
VLSLIVAVAENGVIGAQGALPWRLPDELATAHYPREVRAHGTTHLRVARAPLPGRANVVISRDPKFTTHGAMVARDLDEAIGMNAAAPEQIVIGGASLYAEALPRAERIYLTRVHARPAGDVFFPELQSGDWGESLVSEHPADARHAYAFSIYLLVRRGRIQKSA